MITRPGQVGRRPYLAALTLLILAPLGSSLTYAVAQESGEVAGLIEQLGDSDANQRRNAATALERLGPAAAGAAPALAEAMGDEDVGVRQRAAMALGRLGPAAAGAVPALTELLKHEDEWARRGAAEALGGLGPAAADAIPALAEALGDEDALVRQAAAEALGQLGPAAEALGRIGPAAAGAIPSLAEAIRGVDRLVREAAAEALGRLASGLADRDTIDVPTRWRLQDALKILDGPYGGSLPDPMREGVSARISTAINHLLALENEAPFALRLSHRLAAYVDEYPWLFYLLAAAACLAVVGIIITFCIRSSARKPKPKVALDLD